LITNRLQQNAADSVEVLHGTVSAPLAWFIAQVLYVVFGALALSGIRRYYQALVLLNPSTEILGAIRLFPSLATQPGRFFRLGSVFLPVAAAVASWIIELAREHQSGAQLTVEWFMGLALVGAVILFPYAGILYTLRALRLLSPEPLVRSFSGPSASSGTV
jgi:hypothetical protein